MTIQNVFHVIVDYRKSLWDMIKAGNYDRYNGDINASHFPIKKSKGRVKLNIELVYYGKFMVSDEVVRDLDNRGLRPATLPELLAFGAKSKYPDIQCDFPIVVLGSVWRNKQAYRLVPILPWNGPDREL